MTIKKRFVISKRDIRNVIFFSLIIFAFLKPDSLEYIGLKWLDTLCVIVDVLVMGILGIFALVRRYKISPCTVMIAMIYLTIGVCTALGTKEFFDLLKVAGTAVGFALFTDYMIQKKTDVFFKASIALLLFLFIINFVTIVQYYPVGMYRMEKVVGDLYFMGHDNAMIYNLIPLCALSFVFSYLRHNRLLSWYSVLSLTITLASELYVRSATGIIEVLLLIVLVVMYDNKYLKYVIQPKILIITYLVFNVLLVFVRIQNHFAWFIQGVLGKDLTFTGRTVLWDFALMGILQNRFLGYGMGTVIYGTNGHTYPHCHNLLLDFLYKGGAISLIFFLVLLFLFSKYYNKAKDKRLAKLILIPTFILLFGEITSAMPYKVYFWSFLVLIQYVNYMRLQLRREV